MNDTITNALARAGQVASQVAPTPAPVAARPRSLEDAMATAGTAVDAWLGVKEGGLIVDKDTKVKFDKIDVTICPQEIKFGYGVRFMVSSRPTYLKSYDGVNEARTGRSWAAEVAQAQRTDPGCKGQYDLADVPMVLTEPLVCGKETGTLGVGKRIGYTTPVTNYPMLMALLNKAIPVYGTGADIPCRLTVGEKKGPTGPYAILEYELIAQ